MASRHLGTDEGGDMSNQTGTPHPLRKLAKEWLEDASFDAHYWTDSSRQKRECAEELFTALDTLEAERRRRPDAPPPVEGGRHVRENGRATRTAVFSRRNLDEK